MSEVDSALFEYRKHAEMWIDPQGRVFYDYAFPPGETADSYIKKGWIWVKSNIDGSLSTRHFNSTRYAYASLKALLRRHEAEL